MRNIVLGLNIAIAAASGMLLFSASHYYFGIQNHYAYFANEQTIATGATPASPASSPAADPSLGTIPIVILGRAGDGNSAPYLTDTILLADINTATQTVNLLSIPRDTLVTTPNGAETKINALYEYDRMQPQWIEQKIQQMTGIMPKYYFVLDLSALETAVNDIGGVNVYVPQTLYDPAFPGPNDTYDPYYITKGWHYMDGTAVMKYVRTRHEAGGDFARTERQRQVIEAMIQKLSTENIFASTTQMLKIYTDIQPNISTDLPFSTITQLWNMKDSFLGGNIHSYGLNSLMINAQVPLGGMIADVVEPALGWDNFTAIRAYVAKNFTAIPTRTAPNPVP
jgi:LCP family protein required for cell wall assembly